MKGKIISISPKTIGGIQETFTANNKIFYVFIVSVDVGGQIHIGDANSTLKEPKWKLNEEVELTIEDNDKATGGKRFKFQMFNNMGNKSYGKPIIERMEIISQNAFSTAINYINALSEDERKTLFEKYGPDDSFINFARRISREITKNAKELLSENETQ